jgi:hypothetical protein
MVSAVKSRPSHYEVLGIVPTASSDEVAAAFARELSRPRVFGGIAEVSIAYQALRDPIKRAAYDASLGLKPVAGAAEQRDTDRLPLPARHVDPQRRPEPSAEPRTASFIASSLRQPVEPELGHDPSPGFRPQLVEAPPKAGLAQQPAADRAVGRVELELAGDNESSRIGWRPIGIAGAVVVAVGLLGAWAGSNASDASEPQQPARTVTVALPQPTPPRTMVAPAGTGVEVLREQPARPAVAVARVEPYPLAQSHRVLADQQPQAPLSEPGETEANASNPNADAGAEAVAPAAPIAADAAHLPLANAVIARTIGRIGYACGQVAATAAIDGEAPGVFKVTCTSGQSYRAAPVGGRYHFKRLGSQ